MNKASSQNTVVENFFQNMVNGILMVVNQKARLTTSRVKKILERSQKDFVRILNWKFTINYESRKLTKALDSCFILFGTREFRGHT